ncbi:hypothetical protein FMN50_20215 [Rhodobacterales bacterium]|nr:hypothetical protein FMN50_20215 [Rhodobacterales bacterium]
MSRLTRIFDLFLRKKFFLLKLRDSLFIGSNHRSIAGLNNAVEKLLDLFIDFLNARFKRLRHFIRLCKARVPKVDKHRLCQLKQFRFRLEPLKEGFEFALQFITPYGFAIALAPFFLTHVVGVLCSGF